jgi:hypothetical protein
LGSTLAVKPCARLVLTLRAEAVLAPGGPRRGREGVIAPRSTAAALVATTR